MCGRFVSATPPDQIAQYFGVEEVSETVLEDLRVIAIGRSDPATDTNINGSAFEKVDAFRTGVLGSQDQCIKRFP